MRGLPIELELRKLGLNEKEVSIYLAGLALGPTSVQDIAKKAKVSRPTAYVIIKNLERRGLFAEVKQKKKKYYAAQSPDRILGLLRTKKREIEEREREFIRIIAALESKYSQERGEIREYKGKEGLKVLKEKFSFTFSSDIFVLSSDANLKEIKEREEIYQRIKKRLGEIEVKEIYSKKIKPKPSPPWLQKKFLSSLNLNGTLILFDKVIYLSPQKKKGILIESELIVALFKSLFFSLWNLI